uniref:BPTI/Kunitz inhibitor domain-containing protein n=1 Tax=Sus scrofa TaxID=9823 RepID=A0A8W4F9H3_PIG
MENIISCVCHFFFFLVFLLFLGPLPANQLVSAVVHLVDRAPGTLLPTDQSSSRPAELPPAFCLEPPYTGPCKARMIKYFYNIRSRSCEEFIYGGCEAKKNNFEAMEDCMRTCGSWRDFCGPVLPRDAED